MSDSVKFMPFEVTDGVIRMKGLKKKFCLREVVNEYNFLIEVFEDLIEDFNFLDKGLLELEEENALLKQEIEILRRLEESADKYRDKMLENDMKRLGIKKPKIEKKPNLVKKTKK